MTFCFHSRLSDVKDGYQYCLKCNKAFCTPVPVCNHIWDKVVNTMDILDRNAYSGITVKTGKIIIKSCSKCGVLHESRFNV